MLGGMLDGPRRKDDADSQKARIGLACRSYDFKGPSLGTVGESVCKAARTTSGAFETQMTNLVRRSQGTCSKAAKLVEPEDRPPAASNLPAAAPPLFGAVPFEKEAFDLDSASWEEQVAYATKLTNEAEAAHKYALGRLQEARRVWAHAAQSSRAGEVKQILASKALAFCEAEAAAQTGSMHDAGPAAPLASIFLESPSEHELDDESNGFLLVDPKSADEFETLSLSQ